jgi:hypothetical protein
MKTVTIIMAIVILAFGCAHSSSTIQVQEKISEFDDVDTFVNWLDEQPGIWDVKVNKQLFLTSLPPKVIVTYYQNAVRHKLLLQVEPDQKLRLVKPE